MKINWKIIVFFTMCSALMIGCTATRSEFTTFAQAGGGYATAVDRLLVAAGIAQVDSTSWALVVNKVDNTLDDTTYNKLNVEDLNRLKQINRLRRHAQLLGQYFGLLESLATSDAPQRTELAIEGVVNELNNLNLSLPPGASALPAFGALAVDWRIRAALRRELESRKDVIRSQLFLQEELLKVLGDQIVHALNKLKQDMENELVINPLEDDKPLKNPEQWVSTRRRIVYMVTTVQEINSASKAATKLRQAFEGLLSGEMTIGRLNSLITDIEGLLAIAETIRS